MRSGRTTGPPPLWSGRTPDRTGPEDPAGPIAGPKPDLLPNLDRTQKPDRIPMAISPIFLKFGVLRVANVNSWHIDFQVNRTNRFRAVAIGIWMIFFYFQPFIII